MSKKILPYILSILLLAFPFRWAYLLDVGPVLQLIGMVLCIFGFFTVVILFDRARGASH